MKPSEILNINIITQDAYKSYALQSECNLAHTPYNDEIRFFSCVKDGDSKRLLKEITPFLKSGIVVGKMSDNSLQQYRYIAVSTITLATRYAIQGGLEEGEAYAFSDKFIKKIDEKSTKAEILDLLAKNILDLTNLVSKSKSRNRHSPYVRKAIDYINRNITKKLSVKLIAAECSITPDYMSHLFYNEMGCKLSSYITSRKLEVARAMLWEGYDNRQICTALSFCSQSHFISLFKKEYGLTPSEYLRLSD